MEGLESSRVGVTTARLFMIPAGKPRNSFRIFEHRVVLHRWILSHTVTGSLVSRTCCVSRDL